MASEYGLMPWDMERLTQREHILVVDELKRLSGKVYQ